MRAAVAFAAGTLAGMASGLAVGYWLATRRETEGRPPDPALGASGTRTDATAGATAGATDDGWDVTWMAAA